MPPAVKRTRRTAGPARVRESHIPGLAERARRSSAPPPLLPLSDALALALPGMRNALLNRPFDEAVGIVAEGFATALAPAAIQIWIADPAAWSAEQDRAGGHELSPLLRMRATAAMPAGGSTAAAEPTAETPAPPTLSPDALIAEVATHRRPLLLFDAAAHPLAGDWPARIASLSGVPVAAETSAAGPLGQLSTLAAHPLRVRGQLLGVLVVGCAARLGPRQLQSLDEIADLTALAADRDRLLSYSQSQEVVAQTVVRHASVAIAALSGREHSVTLANAAFGQLIGHDAASPLTGRCLSEIVPQRAAELAASLRLDAVLEGGEPQAMIELPLHSPERGLSYWNITSSPLPGRGAGAGGVLVAAVDVTRQVLARQRAQEVAEVAQERIGQMLSLHATSLDVASQLGADPSELLADILRRSIALLGARAGAVYARDPRHDELEVIVCQGLRGDYAGSRMRLGEGLAGRVAQTGKGVIVDDYPTSPLRDAIYEGEDFRSVIAVPLRHRSQVVGVLDVLDDAERRTFTDDDLWLLDLFAAQAAQAIENARTYVELDRAYRKQRELDRLKDDFIATASHELRTPLTGIQGFLDLLLDYPGSRDDPRALDFLRRAAASTEELADIAERLLQTSRLDSGRLELHIGPVRLAPVVDEVLRAYCELQAAQGGTHELVAEVPPQLYVRADLGRLKEVLDNLVGNAIKYSPRGGVVRVRCEPAQFDALAVEDGLADRPTLVLRQVSEVLPAAEHDPEAPLPAVAAAAAAEPYYVISVRDEGMGIPPGERERLFGRFSRLDSARASQIRGTGLGLYICRQIMRAMAGDIWLQESTPGLGSTFALALAAAVPTGDGATLVTAPEAALQR